MLPLALPAAAQRPAPIQDNSFLIEEAYNQERGVVQHIGLLQRARHGGGWAFSVTQEWPLPNQRHQLGFTAPLLDPAGTAGAGIGDLLVNYRLQAVGGDGARLWVAPRASAVLPSGDWRRGRGDGSPGLQLAIPVSIELGATLAAHLNGSISWSRSARSPDGARAAMTSLAAGASLVWLPVPNFNLLTELLVEDGAAVAGAGLVERSAAVFVAPGVRWAHNFRSGLQVVPGAAYAVGLGDAEADSALLLYLSFEHRFRH